MKYVNKADALHLEKTISDAYPMKSDWAGEFYLGITLSWDYIARTVRLSMQFQHNGTQEVNGNVTSPSPCDSTLAQFHKKSSTNTI